MSQFILKFQIGPVQKFIAQARSTRDLWSGSCLLSWLVAAGIRKLMAVGGALIFPNPHGQPLLMLPHVPGGSQKDSHSGREDTLVGGWNFREARAKQGGDYAKLYKHADYLRAVAIIKRVWRGNFLPDVNAFRKHHSEFSESLSSFALGEVGQIVERLVDGREKEDKPSKVLTGRLTRTCCRLRQSRPLHIPGHPRR